MYEPTFNAYQLDSCKRQTYRLQHAWSLAASAICWERVKLRGNTGHIDFHSRDDKDQLSHTHFRHNNVNHIGYLQFEAKFVIFRTLKFPKVRCVQQTGEVVY